MRANEGMANKERSLSRSKRNYPGLTTYNSGRLGSNFVTRMSYFKFYSLKTKKIENEALLVI